MLAQLDSQPRRLKVPQKGQTPSQRTLLSTHVFYYSDNNFALWKKRELVFYTQP